MMNAQPQLVTPVPAPVALPLDRGSRSSESRQQELTSSLADALADILRSERQARRVEQNAS